MTKARCARQRGQPATDSRTTEAGGFHPASTRRRSSRSPSVSLLCFAAAARLAWYSSRHSRSVSALRVSCVQLEAHPLLEPLAAPGVLDHPQQDADRPAGEDQHEDGDHDNRIEQLLRCHLDPRLNPLRRQDFFFASAPPAATSVDRLLLAGLGRRQDPAVEHLRRHLHAEGLEPGQQVAAARRRPRSRPRRCPARPRPSA